MNQGKLSNKSLVPHKLDQNPSSNPQLLTDMSRLSLNKHYKNFISSGRKTGSTTNLVNGKPNIYQNQENKDLKQNPATQKYKKHNFDIHSSPEQNEVIAKDSPFDPKRNVYLRKDFPQSQPISNSSKTPTKRNFDVGPLGVSQKDHQALLKDFQNLQKNYERLDKYYSSSQEDIKKYRTLYEQNDKELKSLQQTLIKIKDEKTNLSLELKQNKDYIRKLENKLVNEVKGLNQGNMLQELFEQNRDMFEKVKKDKEHCEGLLENMYVKVQDQQQEIQILKRALDIKAEDFNKKFDLVDSEGLNRERIIDLMNAEEQVANIAQSNQALEKKMQQITQQIRIVQNENEELKLVRESNNQELIRLEEEIVNYKKEYDLYFTEKDQLQQEKQTLLDYIEELNAKYDRLTEQFEQQVQYQRENNKRLQATQSDYQQENFKKTNELEFMKDQKERVEKQIQQQERENQIIRDELEELKSQLRQTQMKESDKERFVQMDFENQRMKEKIRLLEDENSDLNREIEKLGYSLKNYEKEQQEFQQLKRETTHFRKEDFNKIVQENQRLVAERDDLRRSLQQSKLRIDQQVDTMRQLEERNELVQKQVDNLIASKKLLQKTLSEQMNLRQL